MNGYSLMAESYKKAVNEGKITKEEAEKNIKVFEFLASCDTDDICNLVDSGAFNDIIKGYIEFVLRNAGLDDKTYYNITNQMRGIFDISAKEVLDLYYGKC